MSITPDGKKAVSGSWDKTLRLWDLESGQCLAIIQANSSVTSVSEVTVKGNIVFGVSEGEVIILNLKNLPMKPPIMTAARIWLCAKSFWDDSITTVCLWCGQRFSVPEKILDVIRAINRDAGLTPDQSPCLELPAEAWAEPKLLSECPFCHKPLKYNPFIVDNKGKY